MAGKKKMTEAEEEAHAHEVLARGADRKWAVEAAAAAKGAATDGAANPARVAGRMAALGALLAPPKPVRKRRTKEEIAAAKAEKAAKEKAAAAKAAAAGKK